MLFLNAQQASSLRAKGYALVTMTDDSREALTKRYAGQDVIAVPNDTGYAWSIYRPAPALATRQHMTTDDFGQAMPTCRAGLRALAAYGAHCGGVLSLMNSLVAEV